MSHGGFVMRASTAALRLLVVAALLGVFTLGRSTAFAHDKQRASSALTGFRSKAAVPAQTPQVGWSEGQRVAIQASDAPGYEILHNPGALTVDPVFASCSNGDRLVNELDGPYLSGPDVAEGPGLATNPGGAVGTAIDSAALRAADENAAMKAYSVLSTQRFWSCFASNNAASPSVTRVSVPHNQGITVFRTTDQGVTPSTYFDWVVVRVKNGLAILDLEGKGNPFPTDERIRLTTLVQQRLQQALGEGRSQIAPVVLSTPIHVRIFERIDGAVGLLKFPLQQGQVPAVGGSIDWGDGGSSSARVQPVGGNLGRFFRGLGITAFSIRASHTYESPGRFTLQIRLFPNGLPEVDGQSSAQVDPLDPLPEATVNPTNPSALNIALMVPSPPLPGRSKIVNYAWTFADTGQSFLDCTGTRDLPCPPEFSPDRIAHLLSDLANDPGNIAKRALGQALGILPTDSPLLSLNDDQVRQLVKVWQAYLPLHDIPHIFIATGTVPVVLRETDVNGRSGTSTVGAEVGDHCDTWGGGWIPLLKDYTTCDTAKGAEAVAEGPRRFPPDYFTVDVGGSGGVATGGLTITVTHDGTIFVGVHAGVGLGTPGSSQKVEFGYVGAPNTTTRPPDSIVDDFVNGRTLPVGGNVNVSVAFVKVKLGITLVLSPPNPQRSYPLGGVEYVVGSGSAGVSLEPSCSVPVANLSRNVRKAATDYYNGLKSLDVGPPALPQQVVAAVVASASGTLESLAQNCVVPSSSSPTAQLTQAPPEMTTPPTQAPPEMTTPPTQAEPQTHTPSDCRAHGVPVVTDVPGGLGSCRY